MMNLLSLALKQTWANYRKNSTLAFFKKRATDFTTPVTAYLRL